MRRTNNAHTHPSSSDISVIFHILKNLQTSISTLLGLRRVQKALFALHRSLEVLFIKISVYLDPKAKVIEKLTTQLYYTNMAFTARACILIHTQRDMVARVSCQRVTSQTNTATARTDGGEGE